MSVTGAVMAASLAKLVVVSTDVEGGRHDWVDVLTVHTKEV